MAWVVLLGIMQLYHGRQPPDWVIVSWTVIALLLSFPIACPAMFPGGAISYEQIGLQAVLIGVNSLVWGYGIMFVLRRMERLVSGDAKKQDDADNHSSPAD